MDLIYPAKTFITIRTKQYFGKVHDLIYIFCMTLCLSEKYVYSWGRVVVRKFIDTIGWGKKKVIGLSRGSDTNIFDTKDILLAKTSV